jgi:hypothetical protein
VLGGHVDWTGTWSEHSKEYKEFSKSLGPIAKGTFWMNVADFLELFEVLNVIIIPKDWKFHTPKTEFMLIKDTLRASHKYLLYRAESRRDLIEPTTAGSQDQEDADAIFGPDESKASPIPPFLRKPTADDCLVPAAVAKSLSGKHVGTDGSNAASGNNKLPSDAHRKAAIHLARLPSKEFIIGSDNASKATDSSTSSSSSRGSRKRADTLSPDVYANLVPPTQASSSSSSSSKLRLPSGSGLDSGKAHGLESLAEEESGPGSLNDANEDYDSVPALSSSASTSNLRSPYGAETSSLGLSHSRTVAGQLPVVSEVYGFDARMDGGRSSLSPLREVAPSVDSLSERIEIANQLSPRNANREDVLGELASTYVEPEAPKSTSRKLPRVRRSTFVF